MSQLVFTAEGLEQYLKSSFPQAKRGWKILELSEESITISLPVSDADHRPGGTISGPTQMASMDLAAYLLVLARIKEASLAVTSSMNMTFLRRPLGDVLYCHATVLKFGRTLVSVDARLFVEPDFLSSGADPVCHAIVNYSRALLGEPS